MKVILKISNKIIERFRKYYYLYFKNFIDKEKNIRCPFCNWGGKEFLPFGIKPRKNACCPKCNSLERHRLLYLYLKTIINKNKQLKVLHCAPEKILTELFKSYPYIDYLSVDINPKRAMKKEDITNLSFDNNSFDIILCSHVLEHIEDDSKAIKELYRVLKPNGFAILQVPIKNICTTLENSNIKNPKERERVFGQSDHVRIYGMDYLDRLKEAGFKVKIDKFINSLEIEDIKKFALIPNNIDYLETEGFIYYCIK